MALLQVINWDICFENSRTRPRSDQERCLIPNKQSGGGYTALLAMKDGEALYGAFHAMILYLSKQQTRDGWLTLDGTGSGKPFNAKYLADQILFSEKTTERMLTTVVKDIGWLVDHSIKGRQEGVPYPGKRVDIKFIAMAQEFHAAQADNHPNQIELQKENMAKTTLAGAKLLEIFQLKHKWEIATIDRLLKWILTNSFWCHQLRSLASIRKRSRNNGQYKFENARAQMESETELELISGEQLEEEMYKLGLGTDDFKQVPHPRTGEIFWRRKS